MTQEKKEVDWASVERHYRAGVMVLRDIASEYGVTEGSVRKRAKRDNWTRDLGAKIQSRAAELVRKQVVRKSGTQMTQASEKETVEINAQATAIVLIRQKGSIQRSHALFESLMSELDGEDGMDLQRRIGSAVKLTEILERVIKLEREAFGVDADKQDNPMDAALKALAAWKSNGHD